MIWLYEGNSIIPSNGSLVVNRSYIVGKSLVSSAQLNITFSGTATCIVETAPVFPTLVYNVEPGVLIMHKQPNISGYVVVPEGWVHVFFYTIRPTATGSLTIQVANESLSYTVTSSDQSGGGSQSGGGGSQSDAYAGWVFEIVDRFPIVGSGGYHHVTFKMSLRTLYIQGGIPFPEMKLGNHVFAMDFAKVVGYRIYYLPVSHKLFITTESGEELPNRTVVDITTTGVAIVR